MSDYFEGIRETYYGEVVAEGFYGRLALGSSDDYQRAALAMISEVEGLTHRLLAPFAAELGIRLSDEDKEQRIRRRVEQLGQFDWQTFIRKANREWPHFLERFADLERMARARGESRLKFLVDHERALLDFVRLELINPGSRETLAPMQAYIAMERL